MLAAFEKPQAFIFEESEREGSVGKTGGAVQLSNHRSSHKNKTGKRTHLMKRVYGPSFPSLSDTNCQYICNLQAENGDEIIRNGFASIGEASDKRKRGMVLPFEPHSITFDDVIYSVDMPQVSKFSKKKIIPCFDVIFTEREQTDHLVLKISGNENSRSS
jgi:hypothetical protein